MIGVYYMKKNNRNERKMTGGGFRRGALAVFSVMRRLTLGTESAEADGRTAYLTTHKYIGTGRGLQKWVSFDNKYMRSDIGKAIDEA